MLIRTILFRFFFSVYIALTAACSSSDGNKEVVYDGKDLLVHFATPKALTGPPIEDLKANLSLNDGQPIELTVNPDNTIKGSIRNVSAGEHTLVIRYYVIVASLYTPLALVTKNVTVIAGETTQVAIVDADLDKNIDSDGDGYTNLAELNIGSNPHNNNDIPDGESILFTVANGSFGQNSTNIYTSRSRVGEPLNGVINSTNFAVVNGFRAY